MSQWDALSKQTQEVYRRLGTRDREEIRRIRSGLIWKAMRESNARGYHHGAPFIWLKHEYERRRGRWLKGAALLLVVAGLLWAYESMLG
ncbi:hypothetical protein [Ferrimonas gelatinilytica]|uniref:Uncharacterized protein n=1 Tax=Ferrimonas gelatinilytica TaxID=1255257 RepID=A0ABP9RY32_9GAMM